VVIQALKLKKYGPDIFTAFCRRRSVYLFYRPGISQAVGKSRVAANTLRQGYGFMRGLALKKLFYSSMRETKPYLKIYDRLSGHAETKMPRADNAGMHRPDRYLKNALSLDPVEFVFGQRTSLRQSEILAQRIIPLGPILIVQIQSPRVRMTLWLYTEHFLYFTFKKACRVHAFCQRIKNRLLPRDRGSHGYPLRPFGVAENAPDLEIP
jgi:hypothetical protein